MPRRHEQFDADHEPQRRITEFATATNRFRVPCSLCGRSLFVDEAAKRKLEHTLEYDQEAGLLCSECESEDPWEDYRSHPV